MDLRFTPDALDDLRLLKEWLQPRSPSGHRNVVNSITRTIRALKRHPFAGRATERPEVREVIERRYGFIIPYTVTEEALWILRVYSARREPLEGPRRPDLPNH